MTSPLLKEFPKRPAPPIRALEPSRDGAKHPGSWTDADLEALSKRLAKGAEELDRTGRFPFENLAALHAEGLIGAVAPTRLGGGGANLAQACRIIRAVGFGEPSTALILTMTYLVHRALSRAESRWPLHLREAVWKSAVDEGGLVNNLRVEPDLGSPARGGLPATVAKRTADGWVLSGRKLYSTGIPGLRWLSVWARTDDPEPEMGFFLVPRNPDAQDNSIRIEESWDHLGLRASGSHDAVLTDVLLPADHAVDIRPPSDWTNAREADQAAWMAALLCTLYDAVAWAGRAWLLDFLATRTPSNLGAPLSSLARIQQEVGEIEALLLANRALIDDLINRTDGDAAPSAVESGMVKFNVTRNAIRAVEIALRLTGNHGLSRHNPLERHWRDVLCSRVHTPQDDSVLISAGLAAFAARAST
ncbi:MAG: acyl-CoA dehydrogenase family protein [Burkholderiaceae bacterium]|jgi:alkylation response protein AidB-like acyl-CoA dehydrogenase